MTLLDIKVEKTLFIVLAIVAAFIIFLLLFYPLIKRFLYSHFTMRMYYKTIWKVTQNNDFLLINDFANYTASEELFHINHIMIGDKYIYCIRDRYYDGSVGGLPDDQKWFYWRKNKKREIPNPMAMNKLRVERISLMSSTPEKHFVSIVLVNNDCFVSSNIDDGDNSYIVSLRKFPQLISSIEKRDVDILDPERAEIFAHDISSINISHGRKKK